MTWWEWCLLLGVAVWAVWGVLTIIYDLIPERWLPALNLWDDDDKPNA